MTRFPPTPTAEDVVARPALSATSYYPFAVFVNVRSLASEWNASERPAPPVAQLLVAFYLIVARIVFIVRA